MRFKTKRIEQEWDSTNLDFRVRILALALDWYCKKNINARGIILTDIFRTNDEQRQIYKNNARFKLKSWMSVHQLWRGIDVGVNAYTEEQRHEMCNFINKYFEYAGSHNSCVYHRVKSNIKSAWHFHLQVDPFDVLTVYK